MIRDAWVVMRKEWTEFFRQGGGKRTAAAKAFLLILVAFTFARTLGRDFGNSPVTALVSAFLAAMFILPIVTDSFAGEREHHTLETLLATRISDRGLLVGKLAANVSYGWSIAMAITGTGVVLSVLLGNSVNWLVLFAAAVAALLSAMLATAVGVLFSLEAPTVKQATQLLGVTMIALIAVPALAIKLIPQAWFDSWPLRPPTTLSTRVVVLGGMQMIVILLALTGVVFLRFRRGRLSGERRGGWT